MKFTLEAADGRARAGVLHLEHGAVETPVFMPVGTAATVKAMTPAMLEETGASLVLAKSLLDGRNRRHLQSYSEPP